MSLLAIISPSKDLDFKKTDEKETIQIPRLWNKSLEIVDFLKTKKAPFLKKLMGISDKLANENKLRYDHMSKEFTLDNSKPALFAFSGDVYRGINAQDLDDESLNYLNSNLRILSGLYGLLKPTDSIQAYRLEMSLSLKINSKNKTLYQFWNKLITDLLNEDLSVHQSTHLINLASDEYSSAIQFNNINVPIIQIHFREMRNGKLNFFSFNAKKARGMMIRFMAIEKINNVESLKQFNLENYHYDSSLSNNHEFYFIR